MSMAQKTVDKSLKRSRQKPRKSSQPLIPEEITNQRARRECEHTVDIYGSIQLTFYGD